VPAVLAAANANWNAGGSILTFYFPIGLFVVIAALLYLQFGRPHKTPGHHSLATSAASPGTPRSAAKNTTTGTADPDEETTSAVGPPGDNAE
jgi:hypothetical protein